MQYSGKNVFAGALALAVITGGAPAWAQSYPAKPVRIIVAFGAGGTSDIVTRTVSRKVSEGWNQQIVIDNRPGAAGNIGSEIVANAAPDGYTLLSATVATHGINANLYRKIPFDPVKDFTAVTLMALSPSVIMLHPSLPVNSVKDLIALAKAKPGQLNYGSTGNGSSHHLAGVLFESMAGVKMSHVPYKATPAIIVDLTAGEVQLTFDTLPSAMPHVKAKRLKSIAVTSLKRAQSLPELPTVSESGLRGYEVTSWYGIVGPARMPPDVVKKLNADIVRAIRAPDVNEKLIQAGAEPVANSPEEFDKFIGSELKKWAKVVQASGAKID